MYQPGLATPASGGGGGAVYLCRAAACAAPLCSVSPGLVPASHCSMVPTLGLATSLTWCWCWRLLLGGELV